MSSIEQRITEDDPLLTAYALGELEGEELARVEDALAREPVLRVSVERIRLTCGAITEALAAEPAGRNARKTRGGGRKGEAAVPSRRRQRSGALLEYPGLYFVVGGLSAACFAILALLQSPVQEGQGLAKSAQPPRTFVPLPFTSEQPEAHATKTVVEELVEQPAQLEVAPVSMGMGSTGTLVAETPPPTSSEPPPPVASKEPVAKESSTPFQPTLQLPLLAAGVSGAVRPPLFEGYGAGSILHPFEGQDEGADRAFVRAAAKPVSELGVRVESASYARVRSALLAGHRPAKSSVHIEQLLNSFSFVANQSAATEVSVGKQVAVTTQSGVRSGGEPPLVATQIEYAPAPWNPSHLLVRVALQARPQPVPERPAERLVVLVEDSLPSDARRLLSEALRGMVGRLRKDDRVVLGRLGGGLELLGSAEAGAGRWDLQDSIDRLCDGERTAESLVSEELLRELPQASRIIVCTAGEPRLPAAVLASSAPLAVLNLGEGALAAQTLGALARRGSFRCDRAESVGRARELLMEEAGNPDPVVARRTLLRTEFNPRLVAEYRVIGYEAGARSYADGEPSDLLAGQSFTALYEVVPAAAARKTGESGERETLLKVMLSYEDTQRRLLRKHQFVVLNGTPSWERASDDFRFSAAVAAMGMIMRDSPYRGTASLEQVGRWASGRAVSVPAAEREEFSLLLERAKRVF